MDETTPSGGARPIGSHGGYEELTFPVPAAVASAARDGLRLRKKYGRGGTDVGEDRAKQLSSGHPRVTLRDIVHIRSYFQRHAVDNLHQKDPPSNGWIAWQLWGGHAGRAWAEKLHAEHIAPKPKRARKRSARAPWEDEELIDPSGLALPSRDAVMNAAKWTGIGVLSGAVITTLYVFARR